MQLIGSSAGIDFGYYNTYIVHMDATSDATPFA